MKEYPNIDYAQQPASYWDDQDVLGSLLQNVKGSERRKMIAAYWQEGKLEELSEELLQDTLTNEVRQQLGRIHLVFLGGEFLPDYAANEVEIARIELRSVTATSSASGRAAGRGGLPTASWTSIRKSSTSSGRPACVR